MAGLIHLLFKAHSREKIWVYAWKAIPFGELYEIEHEIIVPINPSR
jgi:hypothetical protein